MESQIPESQPATLSQPAASWWSRMLNIFVTPGEVFDEIKARPPISANWLGPALIYGVLAAIATVLIVMQPAIAQKVHEQQAKTMDDLVKGGKLTQEQADKQLATMESIASWATKVGGGIAGFAGSFIEIFWWGLMMWLIARFAFKVRLDFMKLVEIAGLCTAISILEVVIRTLLVVTTSNPEASPSLHLLIQNPATQNKLWGFLALANPLAFWVLAARSIGLAKVSGVSTGKALAWVIPVWLLPMSVLVGLGIALKAITQK